MKKTLFTLFVLGMACLLAACGGGSTGNTDVPAAQDTPSAPSQSTPAPTAPTTPTTPTEPAEKLGPEGQHYGGMVRITIPSTLVPYGLPWETQNLEHSLLSPSIECLVVELGTGEVIPHLAESYEVDVENSEIRFKLREDVYFTDGSKFNAEIVGWSLEKNIEVNAINQAVRGVEVRGEYEVAILLHAYNNSTLAFFANHTSGFASKENYDKNGEEYARTNPVATGPFIINEKATGQYFNFVRNDNYWQEGRPFLDKVEYIELTESMTQMAAIQSTGSDALDILRTVTGEQYALMKDNPDLYTEMWPGGLSILLPSSRDENHPLANPLVRQAIYHAINREELCEARGNGLYKPANQLIPEGYKGNLPEYNNISVYDPAKSRELLAQAGYPNGLTITFNSPQAAFAAGFDPDTAIIVQNMLEAVGINCDMSFPESGAATELRVNGWDGLLSGGFPVMLNSTSPFRIALDNAYQFSPSTWRPWDTPGISDTYELARQAIEVPDDLMKIVQKEFMDTMTVIPLYMTTAVHFIKSDVHDSGYGKCAGSSTVWLPWEIWRE